jgi:glycosyltransferase involved in cell wall biosynthesis
MTSISPQPTEPHGRWPLVTVVVPTRDRPALLDRAVASILGQRYLGAIECVLVFDQSLPDREPQERNGRVLRVTQNDRTPGPAGARNTGALLGKGELIAFCDDDDEWLPDMIRTQVEAMEASGAPAAACGHVLVQERRSIVRLPQSEIRLEHLVRSRTVTANVSSVVVRRSLMDRVGLFDESLPGSYAEDYDWFLRLTARSPILGVRQPLVRKYWDGGTWFPEQWDVIVAALQRLLSKHPELAQDPRGLARLTGKIAFGLAAQGKRWEALRMTRRTLALDWRQPRAYFAFLVAARMMRPESVQRAVRRYLGKRI